MNRLSSQNFCIQCGAQLPSEARYCAECGAPVLATSAGPTPTGEKCPPSAASLPPSPRKKRRRPYGLILRIWAVLALLVAVSGFVYGWVRESAERADTINLSMEQKIFFASYGSPDAWVVADGPTSPNGGHARLEEWYYYSESTYIAFVNGTATDTLETVPVDRSLPMSLYVPYDFDSTLVRSDVEQMLDEPGTLIDGVESPFPGYMAYDYPSARLLVGYLDDRLYTAQTY